MNTLFHLVLNMAIAYLFGAPLPIILAFGAGGVLIDIDHILYMIFSGKAGKIKDMIEWGKREYAVHRPHFYVFHTIELILAMLVAGYMMGWVFFAVALGFALHLVTDAVAYLLIYRSISPWSTYFSVFAYMGSRRKR